MKSKMKTTFALIAVALMVLVAVVPMAGVLISDNSSAADVPVPSPSTTEKGIILKVVDANNAAIPYAVIKVGGVDTYITDTNGTIKVKWADARAKTFTASVAGFSFTDSITINADVPADSPDVTKTFKAAEYLKTVTVKTKTGETVTDGTITYPIVGGGTANVVVYADGKAYVPRAAAIADADMTYTLGAGKATKDGVTVTGLTSDASTSTTVIAFESIVTISTTDNSNKSIPATGATFTPAATSGGVTADGKYIAAVTIPVDGYKVIAQSTGYTFDESALQTATSYTAKANEKQALIVVKSNGGSYTLTQGKITVSGTQATDGDVYYNALAGGFAFAIKNTATDIDVTFAVQDDANNAMAVDPLSDLAYADFNSTKTVNSTDKAYQISGAVKYNDGSTNVKVENIAVKFNNGVNKYDSAAGTFAIIAKEGVDADLTFTPTTFITSIVVTEHMTIDGNKTYNFVAEQKEKVTIKVQLNNTLPANSVIGGTGFEVKLVPSTPGAQSVNATWNGSDRIYTASLARNESYTVVVTDCALNAALTSEPALTIDDDEFSLADANSKGNEYVVKAVLTDVQVSGYLYAKWVDGDNNNRPMINGPHFVVYTTENVATNQNGFFGPVVVPRGVSFTIYNDTDDFNQGEGKYWSVTVPAVTRGATADVTTSMAQTGFDAYGFVKAYKFASTEAVAIDITAITMQISTNGGDTWVDFAGVQVDPVATGRFNLQLNAYFGQAVDLKVTSVTFENPHFSIADYTTCIWHEFTSGQLTDKVFADQKGYVGTVMSANGYALNGTLTLTTSPGGVATELDVEDGEYVFAVTGDVGTQVLYTVAFTDGVNAFTVWDGQYGSDEQVAMFRAAFTLGETASQDKVRSGTLSTTVTGEFITSQPNANFVTMDYVIAGVVEDEDEDPVAGQVFQLLWVNSELDDVTYNLPATDLDGEFYYVVNRLSDSYDELSNSTNMLLILVDDPVTYQIVSSTTVIMGNADELSIELSLMGVTITLTDAYGHAIDDEVANIYKDGETMPEATVTFENGVTVYVPEEAGEDYVVVLISLEYSLNAASAAPHAFDMGGNVDLVTNEGLVTGNVVDVSGFGAEIDATLVVTIAAKNYEIDVEDGEYSAVLPFGNYTHAYLKGGDYALTAASSGATAISAAGVAADLNADSRIIIGVLLDGQDQALPGVDVVITAGGKALSKVATNDLGIFTAKLKDDMPVQTYATVTAKVYDGTRDLGYSLALTDDDIVYTPAGTAICSTFIAALKTNENMMVITIVNEDEDPVVGLAITATTNQAPAETVELITDENGQAIVHSARDDVHEYAVSYVVGQLGAGLFENCKFTIGTVLIAGTAYLNMEDDIVIDDDYVYITKNNKLVLALETDEDGNFVGEFPRLANWVFTAKYANLAVDGMVAFVPDTHNVDGHYTIVNDNDDVGVIDFDATKIIIAAGYKVAGDDPEEINGSATLSSAIPGGELEVEILFIDGLSMTYVPAAFAANGVWYALELNDGSLYSEMADQIEDGALLFLTNEYRMYIPVVYDGKEIDGAYIELSDNGYLFGDPIDASNGFVVLEAVELGTYIRAIANGYEIIAYIDDVAQDDNIAEFDGDFVAFVAEKIEVFYNYVVDYGDNPMLAKYVDILMDDKKLQLTLIIDNAREEISVDIYDETNHTNIVKKYTFKGWNVNGKTITETSTAIFFENDPATTSYLVAPMFEEVTEDVAPVTPTPVTPDNSVDSNLMFAGIAAIIVAIIAVIFAVVKVLFLDGRDEKKSEKKAEKPVENNPEN